MPSHEPDRVAVPKIAALLIVLVVVILGCAAVSAWLLAALGSLRGDNATFAHTDPRPAFAAPRLQPTPALDIEAYRAEKRAELEGYRWIDREHGVVALPIERAMELFAEREARAGAGTQ